MEHPRADRTMGLFRATLLAVIFIAGFGEAVQQLWNLLLPDIFGLPSIGFWQAVGLLALSWLLFGGWHGLPWRRLWRNPGERWRTRFVKGPEQGCRRAPAVLERCAQHG